MTSQPHAQLLQLPSIRLVGPFWLAEADVLRAPHPSNAWDLRTLFVDIGARPTSDKVLLPGTMLLLCWVRKVIIQPTSSLTYRFLRQHGESAPTGNLSSADMARRLREGQLSLLLVAADPGEWRDRVPNDRLGTLTVIDGHIAVDVLKPEAASTRKNLYRDLDLVEATLADRPGAAALPGALSLHASGLTVYGKARLPWETERVTGPFQVTLVVPDKSPSARAFRVTIERDRLTEAERLALSAAWSRLARAINPGNAAFAAESVSAPAWATLEVANPASLPRMYWELAPWQASPAAAPPLHLEREEVDLVLCDQSLSDRKRPATTLARTVLDDVVITRGAASGTVPGPVTLTIKASRNGETGSVAGKLEYEAALHANEWHEAVQVSNLKTAYHPTETPRALREAVDLPAPGWQPGTPAAPIATPVLWAFMPLEDGWAQLPVPNLTDQIYLDAEVARDTSGDAAPGTEGSAANALLSGAVSFGNDKPGTLAQVPEEQAWTLTLSDADKIDGVITLTQPTALAPLALSRVSLSLTGPEVTLNGLVWFAASMPSAENALPALDDWVRGLSPIALRSVDAKSDVLPPLVVVAVPALAFTLRRADKSFPWAQLGAWSIRFEALLPTFIALASKNVLPANLFGGQDPDPTVTVEKPRPLLWRRHRTLPMIQALPLTQSSSPASFPSPSRQLVPFELPVARVPASVLVAPAEWTFGRQTGSGAAAWPLAQGSFAPAREWSALADLPLVSLSIPGLVLDPHEAGRTGLSADAPLQLPRQYRFDLPYCDESHALAKLPKLPRPPGPLPLADESLERPEPLRRDTFVAHWNKLSERASLAAADAVAATALDASGQPQVQSLVESLTWRVAASVDTASYPGRLRFANAVATSTAPITLEAEAALQGLTGYFVEQAGGLGLLPQRQAGAYELVAGSMAAHAAGGGMFRDQRGLLRGATMASAHVLRTPVQLVGAASAVELTSLLEPMPLHIGPGVSDAAGSVWQLWFRDLPASGGTFERHLTRSELAQDVNDPEASSRERGYLNGWEWRLQGDENSRYWLFSLEFFPLTLEKVTLQGDNITHVELVGRLQLPVSDGIENEELSGAVRLSFDWEPSSRRLALSAVGLESPLAEWPLGPHSTEAGAGPRILWQRISLDTLKNSVVIDEATLVFQLFSADWRVPLDPLRFTAAPAPMRQIRHANGDFTKEPLSPRQVVLQIQPSGKHEVSLLMNVVLGHGVKNMHVGARPTPLRWQAQPIAPATQTTRSAFKAEVRFQVLGAELQRAHVWEKGFLFDDLELSMGSGPAALDNATFSVAPSTLEFRFGSYVMKSGSSLQLLPGMHLVDSAAPGFVALSFKVLASSSDVPTLQLTSSFAEAVLGCKWGEFLQDPARPDSNALVRVCGSSAGDLVFGYTGTLNAMTWQEVTVLNGFIELKDLVSWPTAMSFDAAKVQLTLPAARAATSLDHLRHTIRILFDQHSIPPSILETSNGALVFQLVAGKAWQFLAVVEHQLVDIAPGAAFDVLASARDRRWTAVQEVRLLSPASFEKDLLALKDLRLKLLNPDGDVQALGDASFGYLGSGLRARLAEGTQSSLDALAPGTIIVEASAVHWLRELALDSTAAATPLQYLPGGTQLAVLSRPEDYGPTDPRDPAWLLLQMPFLGRLQDQSRDFAQPPLPNAPPPPLLQIDPVLNLQRRRSTPAAIPPLVLALSGWAEKTPVVAAFAAFDTAVGRRFTRLDPRALEESWFFLQTPTQESVPPNALPSVLAALPSSPARLGRPAALTAVFDSRRKFYPPQPSPLAPADDTTDELVWRASQLFVMQAVSSIGPSNATPYGWLAAALQIVSGLLPRDGGGSPSQRLHVAATALPVKVAGNPVPSGIAVSPFLALQRRPAPDQVELRLVVAELLCVNHATGRLHSVATQCWESKDRHEVRQQAAIWATQTHQRLSPESSIAVLRFRELSQNTSDDGSSTAALVTSYDFALVSNAQSATTLASRTLRLRAGAADLRYRDGHFGGPDLPSDVHPVELAPPQVSGVQPLYLPSRPASGSTGQAWPWGLSALTTVVNYTHGKRGTVGRSIDSSNSESSLLWQSLQHQVAYRSALSGEPAAGLPQAFRAKAIRSLLPVLPDPPLPTLEPAQLPDAAQAQILRLQPVLPGTLRTTLLAARPGVFLSLRHQLLRQARVAPGTARAGQRLVSGGIPVQHRVPRPVPLPLNIATQPDVALQTWASWFEPTVSLLARSAPLDEAFFAQAGAEGAHRLQLRIVAPNHGEIRTDWNGALTAQVLLEDGDARFDEWIVTLRIEHRGRHVVYGRQTFHDGVLELGLVPESADEKTLSELLLQMTPGETLVVKASVTRVSGADAFYQVLSFPFRLVDDKLTRPPLEPFFVMFEDPEYNRLLASEAKHATAIVKTGDRLSPTVHAVTLAADRAEYGPADRLALRFDFDDDSPQVGELAISLLDSTGVARPLVAPGATRTLQSSQLLQLDLTTLVDASGARAKLCAGHTLNVRLELTTNVVERVELVLTLGIVDAPVTPVPQAAYALLRRQVINGETQVECVRFAWSPAATRVELTNPKDLRSTVVRRRAVFLWTDTARALAAQGYAIQKITGTGSTHVPNPNVLERS